MGRASTNPGGGQGKVWRTQGNALEISEDFQPQKGAKKRKKKRIYQPSSSSFGAAD